MKGLAARVDRLEAVSPNAWPREAERAFWDAIAACEASFADEAAAMGETERTATLTIVEHMAWLRRFNGETDLARVMSLYGYGKPTTPLGFIAAKSYIHGDETI